MENQESNIEQAIKTIVSKAEYMIDKGECYDRKVTKIHSKSKATHVSMGKILPADEWQRVRIVKIPVNEDAIILYIKKLRLYGDERRTSYSK